MKEHTVVGLLLKTYPFLLTRFTVNVLSVYPVYWSILNGVRIGRKYLGVDMWITDLAFAWCGLVIFIGYIEFVRKYSTHLVRYAQIATVTAIINDTEIKGSKTLYGFKRMFEKFGTVTVVYFADKLVSSALLQISNWIAEKGNFIPEFLKTGLMGKFISSVLKTVVYNVDEIVVSYMYNNKDASLWSGISNGISLYVKSWKSILKAAFFSVLWLKLFSLILNIGVLVFAFWYLWGKGIITLLTFLFLYKIASIILRVTFVEPYQSVSMVLGFYENKSDQKDINGLNEQLAQISGSFKEILLNRGVNGKDSIKGITELVTSNLEASASPVFDKFSFLGKGGKNNGTDE